MGWGWVGAGKGGIGGGLVEVMRVVVVERRIVMKFFLIFPPFPKMIQNDALNLL